MTAEWFWGSNGLNILAEDLQALYARALKMLA